MKNALSGFGAARLPFNHLLYSTSSLLDLLSLPLEQFDWLVQYVRGYAAHFGKIKCKIMSCNPRSRKLYKEFIDIVVMGNAIYLIYPWVFDSFGILYV